MDTLLSYHPRDFLMFSPRVYWALVANNNEAWWPLALTAPLLGLALTVLLARRATAGRRYVLAGMGATWWFVSGSFLWGQYRDINWAVDWALVPFVLTGGLLVLFAVIPGHPARQRHRHRIGVALAAWGTLGHPLGFLMDGRGPQAADTWLLFPDPLVVTTLGTALVTLSGWRLALVMPVPLLWSVVGGATLLGLGSPVGWAMLGAAVAAVLGWLPLARGRQSQRGTC